VAVTDGSNSADHFHEEQFVALLLEHDGHVALEFDPFRTAMDFERPVNTDPEIVFIARFGDSAMGPVGRIAEPIGLATITSDGRLDSFLDDTERILVGKACFEPHYILHLGSTEHSCSVITIAVTRELNQ